jgi:hypothetical protein
MVTLGHLDNPRTRELGIFSDLECGALACSPVVVPWRTSY